MNLKPEIIGEANVTPTAFRDFKNVEWKVGNATLEASKLIVGQVVKPFTAIKLNDAGNYELVGEEDTDIKGALVTGPHAVVINDKTVNPMVPAIRKAALIEARCNGITDEFKEAVKGRITFDV